VLVLGILIIFSLILVQQMTLVLVDEGTTGQQEDQIQLLFGSVQSGVISLFQCISGGENWRLIYDLVTLGGIFPSTLFLMFIVVMWLSFTNIITSMFVNKALQLAQPHVNDELFRMRKNDLKTSLQLKEIFEMMDSDDSKTISYAELQAASADERLSSLLRLRGVDTKDIAHFYEVLSAIEGGGDVHIDTFISGCLAIKGPASSIDLLSLRYHTELFERKLSDNMSACLAGIQNLQLRVGAYQHAHATSGGITTL